ncbi:MAG: hypothetical protein AAGA60_14120 [Cyanobacteria bacterium P01_E01_bin.42]
MSSSLYTIAKNKSQENKSNVEFFLNQFHNAVDNDSFYEIVEIVFTELLDAREIVKCAELVRKREPGGAFYQAKLWAKAHEIIDSKKDTKSKQLKFNQLCNQIGVNSSRAKKIVKQGQLILALEKEGVDTGNLRTVSPIFFQYAQRQKKRIKEYFLEAVNFLDNNPNATYTHIHRNWCQKNGSIKANLDIIKPSDWWAFSHPKWRKEEDFPGSIPGEIYANALYYFAPRRGIAIDPMAGSGMLKRVYDDRERWQKDSNFNLQIHLFDLNPRRPFIKYHDIRKPLPIKADWIFIDPSYYGQSSHLYTDCLAFTENYRDYLAIMKEIIRALTKSLNYNGKLCIFLPKWSGLKFEDPNYNIPADVASIAIACGLNWLDTAYVSRGRQQEPGSAAKNNVAKRERRMRSDTCVLNVFENTGL